MPELTATYRLQMNAAFRFADARARVPYFERLGISHLYLSPVLAARRGSKHGYDVVDPARINPELGTEDDLRALANELHARDMGVIADIVPNHMGIGPENWRWDDVLAHGDRSRFAKWFDIDWGPSRKLVLPVLGDDLETVLERGELSVRVQEGRTPRVGYHQQSFPLDPATLPPELQLATFDPEETADLANLSSEQLRALLDEQHYRLVDWRRGSAEINYRRFFDVNDLAAIRVEDDEVFDETHALILRLVQDGVIDGLRVDHVDGLRDPLAYLRRLRERVPPGTPLVVEKILAAGERLPGEWPVDGTTGYEFLNDLEDLFVEPEGFAEIERCYRVMRRLPKETTFASVARCGKVGALEGPLRADVDRLAAVLSSIARASGRKWNAEDLHAAIVEFIAALPVYRTYIDGRSSTRDEDRAMVEAARGATEQGAFLADLVLGAVPGVDPARRLQFIQRLQQLSGPAAAKGVEDTALYVYVPLLSRNEVGGGPDRPLADATERLHQSNLVRAERWPRSLIATNTHDTKKSADIRARLDALTEIPDEWERSLRRWRRLNARHRKPVKGRLAPDTNTEYLLYQVLVALWPPPRAGRRVDDLPDRAWRETARERLVRYVIKAAREAKTRTSWTDPDVAYEAMLHQFVSAILEPSDDAPFLTDVARLVWRIAPIGLRNSLSRIVIHLTSPGTPDVYQGDELWNFTLVDPDNRRPVDYDARAKALADERSSYDDPFDPRWKLLVTNRLLRLRRERADLFQSGVYRPLEARGPNARNVFAFSRTLGDRHVLTIATRFSSGRETDTWEGTHIDLPADLHEVNWRPCLPGEASTRAATLQLASLLRTIPVAVLAD